VSGLAFASFFSGIGGFELGLERAGHRRVWSCEIDPFARKVFAARFGNEPEGEDICDVTPDQIPEADLWCGGFPCQDLSTAGRRKGINGERSGLVWKLLDLAARKRPRWLLLENVPGLLNGRDADDDDGADLSPEGRPGVGAAGGSVSWFGALLGALDQLGYDVSWRVLDARFFGVPQRRRRVFVLAGRAGERPHPGAVLLEREGRGGNPASRRAARARVARGAQGGADEPRVYQCHGSNVGPLGTLRAGNGNEAGGVPFVATIVANAITAKNTKSVSQRDNDSTLVVANALTASAGHHGYSSPRGDGSDNLVVGAFYPTAGSRDTCFDRDTSPTLKLGSGFKGEPPAVITAPIPFDTAQITSPDNRAACRPGDPAPTLAATSSSRPHVAYPIGAEGDPSFALTAQATPAVAFSITPEGGQGAEGDPSFVLTAQAVPAVAFKESQSGTRIGEVHATLDANKGSRRMEGVMLGMAVRRLTPTECERLQGFPDNWTAIEGASDSHRYRVLGNAVAVPVIEWIGRRLP